MSDELQAFGNIDFEALSELLTAAKACEYLQTRGIEISVDRLRGLARKGQVPGAGKVVGKIAFVKEALADWTPPESVGISRREDGRRPFKLYLNDDEKAQIEELGIGEFHKPKPRKKKVKATEAGAPEGGAEVEVEPDPFEAFGA